MLRFECVYPIGGESFEIDVFPSVLPPDNATLRLGEYAGRHIMTSQVVAPLFYKVTDNIERKPTPAKIVDLGSGTGVLGIAAAQKALAHGASVSSLLAVDISETAAENTEKNYTVHIKDTHPEVETDVMRADWNDPRVWNAIDEADIILCNPPYLASDGDVSMRQGFEAVDPTAMYLPSGDDVFVMYRDLLARSIARLKPFGSLYFRLPKYEPTHNDVWPFHLASTDIVRHAIDGLIGRNLSTNIRSERYEPFQRTTEKIGNDTFRHLHMLSADVLPSAYPYIGIFGDPAHAHYMNGNGALDPGTYRELLDMAGYPHISGGGHLVADRTFNLNYPKNDPRYIDPAF